MRPEPGVDVGLCPQEPETILFAETVADEVRATLKARGSATGPEPVLEALGIGDLADRHPRDLSAGQRLLVATAAVAAGMAPVIAARRTHARPRPRREGATGPVPARRTRPTAAWRSLATHDVELAAAVATRVVMLAGGEVVADGPPGAVLGDSTVFSPQMTRAFGPGWLTPEQVAEALA